MIDSDFIENMNDKVRNIAVYVDPKRDLIVERLIPLEKGKEESGPNKTVSSNAFKAIDNTELFCQNQGYIHMY